MSAQNIFQSGVAVPCRSTVHAGTVGGILTVSLDFELYWGVRSSRSPEAYRENLRGVRDVLPRILDLFVRYGIHATWATVGFLLFSSREELIENLPSLRPAYENARLSPYLDLEHIGKDETEDPWHYAPSLVARIAGTPGQEVGCHTLSHFYCLEAGQSREAFRADLAAAVAVADARGIQLRSLVFPRNQCNSDYLGMCRELGFIAYRGNEPGWLHQPVRSGSDTAWRRVARLADSYLNLSGHRCHALETMGGATPINIPASRFLRPVPREGTWAEWLRLRRIRNAMIEAARSGRLYHLWWHPHNFGVRVEQNLRFLKSVLDHFQRLQDSYGMESLCMAEVAERVEAEAVGILRGLDGADS
jgi:peptidoglycan/xylan/chitin deacetylase (PgdA/CDA1 family)